MALEIDFQGVVYSENFSIAKKLQTKMLIKLGDLDAEVKDIIKWSLPSSFTSLR